MARPVLASDERLLTQKEAAKRLGISLRSIELARQAGQLEVVRLGLTGRSVRITERSLQRYAGSRLQRPFRVIKEAR